jgi:membrane-associated PAP2 superfamily phosphatase
MHYTLAKPARLPSHLPKHLINDIGVSMLLLMLVLAWDIAGADLAVMRWWGDASGFALRDMWTVLHQAGRVLSWAVLGGMAWHAFKAPSPSLHGTARKLLSLVQRRTALALTLASIAVVQLIKRTSTTSCPWDITEFGGVVSYVSHWNLALGDGGPGHCFPSGHSSAAFCFLTLYFMWRGIDAQRARWYLAAVCAAGALFSLTQIVRGAHYPSHVLWTAWLCWTVPACAALLAHAWRQTMRTRLAAPMQIPLENNQF